MTGADLTFDPARLRAVLDQKPRPAVAGRRAAVAVVVRDGQAGSELLFIQRATKDGDPWSGQMAFPGGRVDGTDADTFAAAERETREEVGLDLSGAPRLGSLNDLSGGGARNNLSAVSAHAYWLDGDRPTLTNNYEVADSLWVPLAMLADPARHIDYYWPKSGSHWPGIQLDHPDQVVWGLTLRFLRDLFRRIDHPFID
ncbi:MAG: CoA pyrophosphatase [Actinomycetota bacterium]